MRLTMGGTSLLALLDSGSTHNFIAEEAAARASLPSISQGQLRVTVANGERVQCPGVFRNAPFSINAEFTADFYALSLAGYDVVLGTQWLATLGPILWDFGALTMSFWRGGRRMHWCGTAAPTGSAIQACIGADLLTAILEEFAPVFAEPSGMHPR